MGEPLSSSLVAQSSDVNQVQHGFFQGCRFSPDGLCVLSSTSEDSKLRLYNTVTKDNASSAANNSSSVVKNTLTKDNASSTANNNSSSVVKNWTTALVAQGCDTVRSYAWYPLMNSTEPATCAFIATCRDQPVHLFDAYTGSIRATYRPFNALDELESPSVVEFSPSGQHIWTAGFRTDRCIHVFDLAIPGRESTILKFGKTRRSSDGMKGLVSAMAGAPDSRVFCVGTYSPGSIYVYDDRGSTQPSGTVLNGVCVVGHGKSHKKKKRRFASIQENSMDNDGETSNNNITTIFSQARANWFQARAQSGVTQLQFAPNQDYMLYSSSRRSDHVLKWDLRMLSGNPDYQSEPIQGIQSFSTCSNTNQRLEFDLDTDGTRLFVGGLDSCVRCYSTKTGALLGTIGGKDQKIFSQAVNGVSFHTSKHGGLLAVASGCRQFPSEEDFDKDQVCCSQQADSGLYLFDIQANTSDQN